MKNQGERFLQKGVNVENFRLLVPIRRRFPYKLFTVQGAKRKIVPRLCGYCGGGVDSVIAIFTQLHWSSFNLKFKSSRPCLSQSTSFPECSYVIR